MISHKLLYITAKSLNDVVTISDDNLTKFNIIIKIYYIISSSTMDHPCNDAVYVKQIRWIFSSGSVITPGDWRSRWQDKQYQAKEGVRWTHLPRKAKYSNCLLETKPLLRFAFSGHDRPVIKAPPGPSHICTVGKRLSSGLLPHDHGDDKDVLVYNVLLRSLLYGHPRIWSRITI